MLTRFSRFAVAVFMFLAFDSDAAERITARVIVTNQPLPGDTLLVNGTTTKTWGTNTTSGTVTIGTNLLASTTNLFLHFGAYPVSGITPYFASSNEVHLIGLPGAVVTASQATNWCTTDTFTNTITAARVIRVPMAADDSDVRTNIASQLAQDLEDYSPTAFETGTTLLSAYVDKTTTQTVTGAKTLLSVQTSNLVNVGSAISSVGSASDSEQFGTGALATNTTALAVGAAALAGGEASMAIGNAATATTGFGASAIGNYSTATRDDSLAIGTSASASGESAIGIGNSASSSGTNSLAIGVSAEAVGESSIAIGDGSESDNSGIALGVSAIATSAQSLAVGQSAVATNDNSVAIGYGVTTTEDDQVMLGRSDQTVVIEGQLEVALITNSTISGSIGVLTGGTVHAATISSPSISGASQTATILNGMSDIFGLRLPRNSHTTLANGVNAGVVLTNTFTKITSGPTGAFTIAGVSGGTDGEVYVVYNSTGQDMTIAHESGSEATAANRITTMTGADVATSGNGVATLVYDTSTSRWVLINHQP